MKKNRASRRRSVIEASGILIFTHLHFSVLYNNEYVDPEKYIDLT